MKTMSSKVRMSLVVFAARLYFLYTESITISCVVTAITTLVMIVGGGKGGAAGAAGGGVVLIGSIATNQVPL